MSRLSTAKKFLIMAFFSLCFFVTPVLLFAQTNTTTTPSGAGGKDVTITLDDPLGAKGTITDLVAKILDMVVLLMSPIVVVMILYAGFLFVSARGNAEKLSSAKNALMYAIIGAALVLGAKGIALAIQYTVVNLAN